MFFIGKMSKLKVLVIGNYTADNQISMNRFCELIENIYEDKFSTKISKPKIYLMKIPFIGRLCKKYIAYIDKLIIYPIWLIVNTRKYDKIHIIDSGNAYYSLFCPWDRTIITCHDLLAIRGALGDETVFCEPSLIGILLQTLIIIGLKRPKYICFVSYSTYRDFHRIIGTIPKQKYKIIYNPLNRAFESDKLKINISRREDELISKNPYILMVGSSHPRKNRKISFKVISYLGTDSPYVLVLAGSPITKQEHELIEKLRIKEKVLSYINPSHNMLNYLYCNAHTLIFPSYAEGFGWPIIEAQSSKCPVIASNKTSIPEIAGNGALFSEPDDIVKIANYIKFLEITKIRNKILNLGTANVERYNISKTVSEYTKIIKSI